MSLRWLGVWVAVTVLAGTSIGDSVNRAIAGSRPSVAEVMEELRGSSITCRDRLGQSRAYFHLDLIVASSQYGARVVEKFEISNDQIVRTVIDSDDAALLGRVLFSTITYYDRSELRITTSGASIHALTTTCAISKGDVFVLRPRPSQDWSAYGEWIQLLSTRDRSEAINIAAEHRGASAFQHDNGWYVIVLGPFLPGVAEGARNKLASLGSIPKDSFVTSGEGFADFVWGIQPSPHSLAPVVATKSAPPEPAMPDAPRPSGSGVGTRFSMNGGAVVEISYIQDAGQSVALITLDGTLKPGDHKSFNRAAIDADVAIVALSSPGGDLQAGIEIGQTIRLKEFATLVPKDSGCASACALAWLAGQPRYMEPGARIGFHAPKRSDDPSNQADSAASAIVGAYLNKLGLPSRAIAYFTEKRPADIQWLTFEDADRLGISVKELPR